MKTTIYGSRGTVIGWIARGGCENDRCLAAVAEGRTYHATPAASGVLPDYHFHTSAAAEAALQRAADREFLCQVYRASTPLATKVRLVKEAGLADSSSQAVKVLGEAVNPQVPEVEPRFHAYGPVEVAITEPDPAQGPQLLAKFLGAAYREVEVPVRVPVRAEDDVRTDWALDAPGDPDNGRTLDREGLESEQHIVALLDAAATLAWHEYQEFQDADARMGDPNP